MGAGGAGLAIWECALFALAGTVDQLELGFALSALLLAALYAPFGLAWKADCTLNVEPCLADAVEISRVFEILLTFVTSSLGAVLTARSTCQTGSTLQVKLSIAAITSVRIVLAYFAGSTAVSTVVLIIDKLVGKAFV